MEKKKLINALLSCGLSLLLVASVIAVIPRYKPEATNKSSAETSSMHSMLETEHTTKNETENLEDIESLQSTKPLDESDINTPLGVKKEGLDIEDMAQNSNLSINTMLDAEKNTQPEEDILSSSSDKEAKVNTQDRQSKAEDISSTTGCAIEPEISIEKESNIKPISIEYNAPDIDVEQENKEIKETPDIEHNKIEQNPIIKYPHDLAPVPVRNPKEELIEMLECIVKRNPSLAPKTQKIYNDIYTINALLINRNTVVFENFRLSSINVVEKITLWEVLQACKEGKSIDIDISSSDPINRVTFFYPQNLMDIPAVIYAMFTYYNPNNMSNICLHLLQFDFQFSKNIFNEFQIFKIVRKLIISRTVIHTNTLNILKDFSNLKELSLSRGTILNSDVTASLPKNLERLLLFGIDNDIVNWALSGLSSCHNLYEMDISNIDFMDTYALNNLKDFGSIALFTLRNIVFTGCPNFSFLEKMSMVKKLTMRNIFYSYTEELKVKDLNRIKQSIMYLIPENTENSVLDKYADVVNRNKEVGSRIFFTNIDIDSKLYSDLELYRIEPRECEQHTIRIEFVNNLDCFGLDSIGIEFILNDLQCRLDVNTMPQTTVVTQALLLESLQSIKFPFLEIKTIDTIGLKNSLNNVFKESAIMNILSDQIMKYARNSRIKTLIMVSLVPSVTIDLYKIALFNSNMPDLVNLSLFNVGFDPGSIEYKNSNETSNMEYYKKYIQKNPNSKFYSFIKEENILKFA
ncbi:hypothetical protein NEPAR06_0232 [Nematocida parisii]|uniref:Uncharacterized protein n=1 Tax=Nematocida parisii (strain ERTm3) TaxID=935791 RepID=I3ED96_NEMP3|nr:uncharacterized protein NEPG_00633 [Nematocida parisii ERTm1]EIJ87193.1 hypothetical protein NEQG_02528 [Nematocida parisii ERTm3]KAI5126580.1 hypothetical protein NEPAR08_0499 [Nematocida parisii]EIJ95108.1 hypothetical protein NEPG_00633 [Nematocida parisii ERTm1]KAI5129393.1 hypothetical protein NEPAR03_1651 [Nematocida parisii]KAI5142206.1 hypothetical protein NEPAR04_1452 [Nematocida parisii]|eukprot:XP_013058464.1 hypothetical protein NEPG_00633 [Nematocida parisii ERTm1]